MITYETRVNMEAEPFSHDNEPTMAVNRITFPLLTNIPDDQLCNEIYTENKLTLPDAKGEHAVIEFVSFNKSRY